MKTWNATRLAGSALIALALATGCSDNSSLTAVAGDASLSSAGEENRMVYDQVDFLGNPLVAEVTIVKADHDAYNRTMPYASATFRPQTESFIVNVAGRPAAYASVVAGVLSPDMLIVDSSKPGSSAGWLSWALANGYGGRKLSDDVVDIGLYAIFSSLLSPDGASCAPGALPLCTDNVNANDKQFGTTFPYLAEPTL
ncbi:MAG: DUF4331 family protein [Gemmatimonadaceae bacterium]